MLAARTHPVRVGCSGWNYRDWRTLVYPQGVPTARWLECYAQWFDTVEVNSTFYRLASRDAVARWVAQTPAGFVFAVKASRYLTHVKRLVEIEQGLARFYERIEPLIDAGRLGPVLWQLPETFRRDDGRLREALQALPPGRHAFEFRHPSWFVTEVYELLRRHDAALVFGDHPRRPFQTDLPTASWGYVRLHYGARGRRGNYSEGELDEWARRLHRWRAERDFYVYLNNDWEGFAPRNARLLCRRLAELASRSGRRS
ncbi:MAG: hypothetical protein QOF54_1420 [Solirubrobacteraceae bacterium]|nr:hypothetical protein [Solirubrobacteraceae bacterium]